jgi:hypothetical protein
MPMAEDAGSAEGFSSLLGLGDVSVDDAIAMHLADCAECRYAIEVLRPVAIGQKSALCNTYWQLQLMRAKAEGMVNNIVAHTEYGDEAPKGRPLE